MNGMQESDKHSPRIDDELKHDDASLTHGSGVEARSQDARAEQDTETLPNPADRRDLRDVPGTDMTTDDIDARSKLAMAVSSASFPADRSTLVTAAEGAFAGDDVLGRLRRLPDGRPFENVEAVWEALGGPAEGPHKTQ
jgi:hypothetical protein